MDADTWRKSKEVFDACLDQEPAQWPSYLDTACVGDAVLRNEVESLLASHREAGDFLEQPVLRESFIGQRLGPWKIVADIGEGGMSRVCLAERDDGLFEQRAAVKILKRGMDTDLILRHFQQERQILAGMHHPNIARLLDGGVTPGGRPYFVMEHIEGVPINQYTEKLGVGERLRLFQQVCSAVHYAHQRLVVHRDIKPGNILVTAGGTAKLLDFGIATIVSPELGIGTIGSAQMLTPDYASPEQIRGERVTTSSDVYSLGVLLSKLLRGAATVSELENIAGKATEQDSQLRYSSAEQFSLDIERYLEGRPVLARPHTLRYRASKFIGRNKLGVAAGALVLLSIAGGVAATLWQARRAEENFFEARQLANSLLFELHDAIRELPGSTQARALIVQRSLKYLDRMSRAAPGNARLRLETAEGFMRLGDVQGRSGDANLGDPAAAQASYQKALALLIEPVSDAALDQQRRVQQARTLTRIGGFDKISLAIGILEGLSQSEPAILGDLATSEASMSDLLIKRRELAGALESRLKEWRLRKQLLDADSENLTSIRNYALASKRLGGLHWMLKRPTEAMTYYQIALRLEEDWVAREPANAEARMAVSFSHSDIGFLLHHSNNFAEALMHYRKTIESREELARLDPSNARATMSLVSAYWRTARVATAAGDTRTALDLLKRAEAKLAGSKKPDPSSYEHRMALANVHRTYAETYVAAGDRAASRSAYGRTRALLVGLRNDGKLDADGAELLREIELQFAR